MSRVPLRIGAVLMTATLVAAFPCAASAAMVTPAPPGAEAFQVRPVLAEADGNDTDDATVDPGASPGVSSDVRQAFVALDCASALSSPQSPIPALDAPTTLCDAPMSHKYLTGPARVTGANVTGAALAEPARGHPEVSLELDKAGTAAIVQLSAELVDQEAPRNRVAILVDGTLVATPEVLSILTGGGLVVTGFSSAEQASRFATALAATAVARAGTTSETVANGEPTLGVTPDSSGAGVVAGSGPPRSGHLLVVFAVAFVGLGFLGFAVASAFAARQADPSP